MDRSPNLSTTIIFLEWISSKKIDTVTEGFQVGVGLDELGQRPAFTFSIASLNTWVNQRSELQEGLVAVVTVWLS
jgi:hypothetical protein